jgi:hypothetical protein
MSPPSPAMQALERWLLNAPRPEVPHLQPPPQGQYLCELAPEDPDPGFWSWEESCPKCWTAMIAQVNRRPTYLGDLGVFGAADVDDLVELMNRHLERQR